MSDKNPLFLGLDLGGTKTSVCLGRADGVLLDARRIPTNAADGPERWRARASALIRETLQAHGFTPQDVAAIGAAVPGPMSVARGSMIAPPNLPGWRDVPVTEPLRAEFGRPVFINNDANAAALAEYWFGEFRGTPDLVYLTLSTGVGGGVISGGRLVQGARDLAGEVGHHVLDPDGPPCPCGQRGCFEIYCGGLNVANRVRERLAAGESAPVLLEEAGGDPARIDFRIIAAAEKRGDPLARAVWAEFVERLAQGIGTCLMFFNPSVVVLGTIAVHLGERLLAPVREALPRYAWAVSREGVRIAASALGTRIGDLGALAVAIEGARSSGL